LPPCLSALLNQGANVGEILIYNDDSTDATAEVLAAWCARDECIRVVTSQLLPPGWCGKNFACAQLAQAARGQWLLFLDADARLTDNAVAWMVAEMQQRRLTMLLCWPLLEMVTFAEKALMPMLNTVVFSIFPGVLSLFRGEPALGAGARCVFVI
jgi:chlorobactene glucosyltransferase